MEYAFPHTWKTDDEYEVNEHGLTIREYCAIKAMQAFIANIPMSFIVKEYGLEKAAEEIAKHGMKIPAMSFAIADAMIEQGEK